MKQYKYDPIVTGIIIAIGLVGLWYFSSLAIEKQILPFYFDHIFRFLSLLCGAFAAFRFNSMLEARKQIQEKQKAKNILLLSKIESTLFKLHDYSRTCKKYLCSIERPKNRESNNIVRDIKVKSEAHELIYEIEVYKKLYFPDMPLDAMIIHADIERLAGECDKHWMQLNPEDACEINPRLEAYKLVANEIDKLDKILHPIFDWCLAKAEIYKE